MTPLRRIRPVAAGISPWTGNGFAPAIKLMLERLPSRDPVAAPDRWSELTAQPQAWIHLSREASPRKAPRVRLVLREWSLRDSRAPAPVGPRPFALARLVE